MQKKRMVMLLSKRLISWRYLCEWCFWYSSPSARIDNNYCSIFQTKNVLELYLQKKLKVWIKY
jgi:hypothetical protein